MAYTTIGNYKTGVWLAANPNGDAFLADRAHLPTGGGWHYYWLGATRSQATSRLGPAVAALTSLVGFRLINATSANVNNAFSSGRSNLTTLSPGSVYSRAGVAIGAGTLGAGVAQAIQDATAGVGVSGGAPAAETAAGAGGAGTGAGAASKLASTAASAKALTGTATLLALIKDPSAWLRILEGLLGLILAVMGVRQLASVAGGSGKIQTSPVPVRV